MGFEPTTPGTTIQCSNQLSYNHHVLLCFPLEHCKGNNSFSIHQRPPQALSQFPLHSAASTAILKPRSQGNEEAIRPLETRSLPPVLSVQEIPTLRGECNPVF